MGDRSSTMLPLGASTRALPLGTEISGAYKDAVMIRRIRLRKSRLLSTDNPELKIFHSQ